MANYAWLVSLCIHNYILWNLEFKQFVESNWSLGKSLKVWCLYQQLEDFNLGTTMIFIALYNAYDYMALLNYVEPHMITWHYWTTLSHTWLHRTIELRWTTHDYIALLNYVEPHMITSHYWTTLSHTWSIYITMVSKVHVYYL